MMQLLFKIQHKIKNVNHFIKRTKYFSHHYLNKLKYTPNLYSNLQSLVPSV